MDIVEFFQQSAGKWSSMRTTHEEGVQHQKGGKSTLLIDVLDTTDPSVAQLCSQHNVEAATVLSALKVTWDGTLEDGKKNVGSTLLVPLSSDSTLLRQSTPADPEPLSARYGMTGEQELTIVLHSAHLSVEERIWFESENVRLRHSVVTYSGGFSMASFYSEIRMGVTKPAPQPSDAAAKA